MLALDDLESADAGADEDAHAVGDLVGDLKARLGDGFLDGCKGKMDKAPHLARLFLVHEVQRVKVLDLGGKCDGEASGVKALDGGHTTGPGHELLPNFGRGVAHTAHQPQAGDYDSAGHWLLGAFRSFAFFSM